MSIEKVLYRGVAKATGGRDGRAISFDGALDVRLSTPPELGGLGDAGTNPEQLFAAGYSACFLSAMKLVAARDKITMPNDASVRASVGIGQTVTGFGLEVELTISLPGLPQEHAELLAKRAHVVCPYSNAIRGNVDVTVTLAPTGAQREQSEVLVSRPQGERPRAIATLGNYDI